MKLNALPIAAAALLFSSGAFAQGYMGVGAGPGKVNADCTGTITCDSTNTGYKVFGGFKFAPNWAAELSYFDFGKAEATIDLGVAAQLGRQRALAVRQGITGTIVSGEVKGTGIGLGVAFLGEMAPGWAGVARLGIASTKAKLTGSLAGISASDSESSTNPYFGLGIGYMLTKNLSLDGSLDFSKIKYAGDSANVRLFSVGLTLLF